MKWKRQEITFELNQTTIIRSPNPAHVTWCAPCAAHVLMLSVDQAVGLSSLDARAIYRLIETAQVHFMETSSGAVRVCLNSLHRSQETIRGGEHFGCERYETD